MAVVISVNPKFFSGCKEGGVDELLESVCFVFLFRFVRDGVWWWLVWEVICSETCIVSFEALLSFILSLVYSPEY